MIEITLDIMMAQRRKGLMELSKEIGITPANLSILKNNKAKAIRLETLEKLCIALQCQPGDLIRYTPDPEDSTTGD
jgi:putative transcriptional regulator